MNASHQLDHSPLSTIGDVAENPAFTQAKEGTKAADDQHKAAQE